MANHKTGAQRYKDRKDKIFAKVDELSKTHGSPHGGDHRSEAMKKAMTKKMGTNFKAPKAVIEWEKKRDSR